MIISVLTILLMAFATLVQTSVLPGIGIAAAVLFPLLVLLYTVEVLPENVTLLAALSAGFFLDLYSSFPFGIHIVVLLIVTFIATGLYKRFFTNRSIYGTLVLTAVSTLIYEGSLSLVVFFAQSTSADTSLAFVARNIGERIIGNTAAMIVLFYAFLWIQHALGRRFITSRSFQR